MKFIKRAWRELDSRLNFNYLKFRLFGENRQIKVHIDLKVNSRLTGSPKNISEPFFSIIIPLYGIDLVYVKECIASVERQTNPNWEICFCSDADPIQAVTAHVEKLARASPKKFKVILHSQNRGISKATLSALSEATGDFVVFVDADDTIHQRTLELCKEEILSSETVDFIYTNHDLMTDWSYRNTPFTKPIISPELLLNVNYINHLVIVRHSLLGKIPELFAEYTNGCQDWDFCLKAMHFSRKVVHLPFFLYHWRTRKGSIAESPFAKPWAVLAQLEIKSRYAALASSSIQFSKARNKWELVQGQPYVSLPRFESKKRLEEWSEFFINMLKDVSEKFVHLSGAKMPSEIESQICYAILPKVAFVWPFSIKGFRISYTVINSKDSLLGPLVSYRSTFSTFTGNVLTGPFDHAVIERSKLEKIIESLRINLARFSDFGEVDVDEFVALLGVLALENGFRNASVKESIAEWEGGSVRIPRAIFPHYDPYI